MDATLPEIHFDESQAQRYQPHYVVKQAVLVPTTDDFETTIMVDWQQDGNLSKQRLVGPWYAIYTLDGNPSFYGSPRYEFEATHGDVPSVKNGYHKNTPVYAYRYDGPDATLTTVMASGVHETSGVIKTGDWVVRWPHGETGIKSDESFRSLYDINSAQSPS